MTATAPSRKLNRLAESIGAVVSKREIADLMGVSTRTIAKWIAEKRLSEVDVKINRRVHRWRVGTIQRFIEGAHNG